MNESPKKFSETPNEVARINNRRAEILKLVDRERAAQIDVHGNIEHWSPAQWTAIITKLQGDVARVVAENLRTAAWPRAERSHLARNLVQLMATAQAWLEMGSTIYDEDLIDVSSRTGPHPNPRPRPDNPMA